MQTPREDSNLMASRLRAVTEHDVVVEAHRGDAFDVNVNFDHNCAVVCTPEVSGNSKMWSIIVTAWDRSGGVSDERLLGHVRPEFVPVIVTEFLAEEDRNNARLEALLDASLVED